MTKDEVAKLVELVATRLAEKGAGGTWLPTPTRPEPPGDPTPGMLPAWSGAAQTLPDVAPVRRPAGTSRHRPEYPAMVTAARQAAAARGPSPLPSGSEAGADRASTQRTRREVKIGVSNRHLHVSPRDFEALFGKGRAPMVQRPISQPGQYAAAEVVAVVGPKGKIEGVRIVGPARGATQLEISPADGHVLGVTAPVRQSGKLENSGGGVTLEGPAGKVMLAGGVIVAQRHLHAAPADARTLGVADGDRVAMECGPAGRRVTLHDVLVRMGPDHATELHLDLDEANAAQVQTGDSAVIVATSRGAPAGRKRPLLTERDVARISARGDTLSAGGPYLVTPAARDRAKALGIWRDER
ncbi:MAG: phosphate propanoyltransferase [Gemmatimonadota bacterium]